MWICPICNKAYHKKKKVCDNCGSTLVTIDADEPQEAELDKEESELEEEWVELFESRDVAQLSFVKALLEGEQIPYMIQQLFSPRDDTVTGEKLLVPASQLDEAEQILIDNDVISRYECENCGHRFNEDATCCPNCGTEFSN